MVEFVAAVQTTPAPDSEPITAFELELFEPAAPHDRSVEVKSDEFSPDL